MPTVQEQEISTPQEQNQQEKQRHGDKGQRRPRRSMREEAARLARSDASKTLLSDIWTQGIEHIAAMQHVAKPLSGFGGPGNSSSLVGAQWRQIGPAPLRVDFGSGPVAVAGRVYDIAIDPGGTTDQNIYLATLGGIWKSMDGGATWAPKTDRLPWTQMSAVAVDSANPSIIYAGGIFGPGPSLFRSIDGGETWSVVGGNAMLGQDAVRIVVPSPGVVLVATFVNGVYRSVDGGVSFGNNPPLYNNNVPIVGGLVWDLHVDTAIPGKVYACIGGQGIFVSTDSGATFSTNLFANPGAPAAGSYDAVTMTQSIRPDSNTIYASVSASTTVYLGLYKSTNGGASWSTEPGAAPVIAASAQFGFNQTIGVDPQNAQRLYLGFEEVWLSTNGGATFGATPVTRGKVHLDNHAIAFSPQSHWGVAPTRVYVGTDGGFAASPDGGTTWSNLNEGVATILVEGLDIGRNSTASSQYSYAGSQDNGISARTPGLSGTDWQWVWDGDGGQVSVDTVDPQKAYATGNFGYDHTINAGANWSAGGGLSAGVSAVAVTPDTGANVFAASGSPGTWPPELFQSTDIGANFSLIHTFPAGITCIAPDGGDSGTVWIGLLDGTIWRTDNVGAGAGSIWNSYSAGLPTGRAVNSIAVNPPIVVAGYLGFVPGPPGNRPQNIYLTTNNGASWTDASGTDGNPAGNLPPQSVHSVALDPGSIYNLFGIAWSGKELLVAGSNGAMFTSNNGVNYTAQASNSYEAFYATAWTGTQFVAAGQDGTILTSPDGVVWTVRRSGPFLESLSGVAASSTRIVVCTDSLSPVSYTSPDGISWTQNIAGVLPAGDIVWSGSLFVAAGNPGIVTSPDGLSWTRRAARQLNAVIWTGAQFVAGGPNGGILTSPDGFTWTQRITPVSGYEITALAFSGSRIVGVGNAGGVLTSTDGINWAFQPSPNTTRLHAIAWMGSQFVAVGEQGAVITSPNGLAWTDHSFGEPSFTLIAGTDTSVFRSIDSGATWQVLGVGLPTAICFALALDSARTPSLLRVGTDGRSVFELTTSPTAKAAVISNLAFGQVKKGSSATLTAKVFNVGSVPLTINGFSRISGSVAFTSTGVALPMTIAPGSEVDFALLFQPTKAGDDIAVFQLASTDPVTPNVNVPMSGTGV